MNRGTKRFNLRADSVISNLAAAVILGILNTSILVSFAAIIFSGNSPDYFAAGIAFFLMAGCIGSILISIFSSYPGVIACVQDVPAAISGLMAMSLSGILVGNSQEIIFANIFVAIAVSALLTGIAFILLGYFRLGNFVRFIPYPVMGGFMAGTGWILLKAGLEVSTGESFNLHHAATFIAQINHFQLACSIIFAVLLLSLSRWFSANMLFMVAGIWHIDQHPGIFRYSRLSGRLHRRAETTWLAFGTAAERSFVAIRDLPRFGGTQLEGTEYAIRQHFIDCAFECHLFSFRCQCP